ncbi:MAG: NAD(P)/FAD-dependent oxidoreductase [Treponema sp.]|nr:NAD(P)/FAD-dependent oxidoreductase [Treponema sp.]
MKKKVVVIGGGIAGLSAGIYAQKCGFDVIILESHSIAGGNCTAWKRGDYVFEGGMHWLTGANPHDRIHTMWRYVGALDDSVVIHKHEPFKEYDHNGTPVRLYRDVDATERHLLELSPADAKEIKKLCSNIRIVRYMAMPIVDLRGVKVTKKNPPPAHLIIPALSSLYIVKAYAKVSRDAYINRFSHEGLRELLRSCRSDNTSIAPMFFPLGALARGDGGFPEGGSLPFVERMVNTFTKLGGTIRCNTRADRVIVENGKATGVSVTGDNTDKRLAADAVVIAADTMSIEHLFDFPLRSPWLDEMRVKTEPTTVTLVCLGIKADLRKYPAYGVFKLRQPIELASQNFESLSVSNYAGNPVYSPEGKTAVTVQLPGDTYDFWKQAKEEGRYKDEKQKIADKVISALAMHMPETGGQIEICDVATPLTYERYCSNWKGSWMTRMTPGMKMKKYPPVIKGLSGIYFAGQRMMPPGGLPMALMSARTAIQYLCRDTGTLFISED